MAVIALLKVVRLILPLRTDANAHWLHTVYVLLAFHQTDKVDYPVDSLRMPCDHPADDAITIFEQA